MDINGHVIGCLFVFLFQERNQSMALLHFTGRILKIWFDEECGNLPALTLQQVI